MIILGFASFLFFVYSLLVVFGIYNPNSYLIYKLNNSLFDNNSDDSSSCDEMNNDLDEKNIYICNCCNRTGKNRSIYSNFSDSFWKLIDRQPLYKCVEMNPNNVYNIDDTCVEQKSTYNEKIENKEESDGDEESDESDITTTDSESSGEVKENEDDVNSSNDEDKDDCETVGVYEEFREYGKYYTFNSALIKKNVMNELLTGITPFDITNSESS